jgi:hypothetical protein
MDIKKSDSEKTFSIHNIPDTLLSAISSIKIKSEAFFEGGHKMRTSDGKIIKHQEIFIFRSVMEKLVNVNQEDFTWTWDHETGTFLIQAQNNVINQYVIILTYELGAALCLHLKRVSIIVDLRPWKTNPDKTSLRIGFEGNPVPVKLKGHTGLADLVKLHFVTRSDAFPETIKALKDFQLMCSRIDSILKNKYDWMWERHWKPNGLAFAVVEISDWMVKSALVEKEIELFNNSDANKQAGLHVELSTYNRGTSFNVRIALEGLPDNLRTDTHILEVFDTHFAAAIK